MPFIVECLNPFDPFKDTCKTEVPVGTVIREWLKVQFPGFVEFDKPTICFYNCEPLLRKDWDKQLAQDDVVVFVAQPGAPLVPYLIYALISIVVGVAIALLMPKPKYDSNQSESVYSIRGQQNRVRLGDVIECGYGRCRLWPSYGALPYNRYIGNDQFQYALLCLGQGEWDVDVVQIEDTAISNFQEVQYQIYQPGQPVTLFDDRVNTSSEVSNIEVFAPNEAEYVQWIGPFTANESGTTTTKLEVDVQMPLGLNHMTSKGKMRTGTLSIAVEYRQINDAGTAVGAWTNFTTRTWSLATATPQRYTLERTVPAGRYEVRVSRTSLKDKNNSSASTIMWGQLRSVLPSVRVYPGKTMLALKMRATNNLNDQSAYRVNVWATRKIPIWNSTTGWSAPTATRSIVWACCDICRATYGGQLSDAYLPLADLAEQDAVYTTEGRHFDYIFDQKITVWEALRIAARIGRAVPMIEASQITLIKDVPRTLPTVLFNQNNIQENSFKWNIALPKDGDYDGVLVEYTDPNDFLPRQVKCLCDGDAGDNLEEIKLLGCTDRNWAFREGMYYRESKRKLRQGITFQTGLEGHLPRFGALIGVSYDLPRWNMGGWVVAIAGRTLTLSEPVTFSTGNHYIGIELKNGASSAPLLCTAGADAFHVVLAADAPAGLYLNDQTEPPVYLFGSGLDNWSKNVVVTNITPDSESEVTIDALLYDAVIYSHDTETPSDDPTVVPPVDPIPTVPELNCASVSVRWAPGSNTEALATWAPVTGATSYEVWKSVNGGTDWEPVGVTSEPSLQFPCTIGDVSVRVRPIGAGIGAWCSNDETLPDDKDPWEEEDNYEDLLTLVTPGTVNYSCRTRGGTVSLVGWEAFANPSTPPGKWLNIGGGFTTVYDQWPGSSSCSGGTPTQQTNVGSGSFAIDPVTGLKTGLYVVNSTATGYHEYDNMGAIGGGGCGNRVANTETTSTLSLAEVTCCSDEYGGTWRRVSSSGVHTLTNPDSDESAMLRLLASEAGGTWGEWTAVSGLPGCGTTWTERTTGFTFTYTEAEFKIIATGLASLGFHLVRVHISRTDLATSETVEAETHEFAVYADVSGEVEFSLAVPVVKGYSYAVSHVTYHLLASA